MDAGTSVLAAATAAALALALWLRWRREQFGIERAVPLTSPVDGMPYRVHADHPEAEAAADSLALLNRRAVALARHLRRVYRDDPGPRGAATRALLARYNPDRIVENSPLDPSKDTSYTIDKGRVLALCLRNRGRDGAGPGALHDDGVLTFVLLHEMAHIASDEVGHPPGFWRTFKWLLLEAEAAGLYWSPDYAREPLVYCGLRIAYNPRYDADLPAI
jgi:hypothetical protein